MRLFKIRLLVTVYRSKQRKRKGEDKNMREKSERGLEKTGKIRKKRNKKEAKRREREIMRNRAKRER